MNRYFELVRLENLAIGLIGFIVSTSVAGGNVFANWPTVVLGCVIVVLFIAGGNSLNDYLDREVDKVAHPSRPLPSEKISSRTALSLGMICLTFSCVLSFFQRNIESTLIVVTAIVIIILYEIFLKKRGFVGNVSIAILTGMMFLLGGSVTDNIEGVFEIAGMAMVVTVGREITKDIEDAEGDKGRCTLPMLIGRESSARVAALFYVVGIILSATPIAAGTLGSMYLIVLVADVLFIYSATTAANYPHQSQKSAKVAMAVSLVAFLFGSI
ncbi:MAG: geranylgeranylglycerol-phosphate geranylgeranyltransferase [archaeon]|nr:geranylgeranylglycerol-phosphate geranylgeranyltransferase [archaeon]